MKKMEYAMKIVTFPEYSSLLIKGFSEKSKNKPN